MAAILDGGLPGSESAELDFILPEVELEDSEDDGARGSGLWREAQARRAVTSVLAASSGPFRHELARLLRCLPRRPPLTNGVGLGGGPSASGGSGADALYDSDVCGDASSRNGGGGNGGNVGGGGWPKASDDDRSSGVGGAGSSGSVLSDDGVPEMLGIDYGGVNVGFCGRYRGLMRSPPRPRPAPQSPLRPGSIPTSPSVAAHGAAGMVLPPSPTGFPHSVSTGTLRSATALSGALSPEPRHPQQQLLLTGATQSAPDLDLRSRALQRQTAANAAGAAAASSAGFVFTPLSATAPNGGFGGGAIGLAGAEAAAALATEEATWREMPLADITAVYGSDSLPEGFVRVSKSVGGKRADLNSGAGGQYLYLCVRKGASAGRAPIVGLAVIYPDRDEYVPPGYAVIRRKGQPVNLNHHTTGERVYLCYRRGAGNPLCDVAVVVPSRGEGPPKGYHLLESSPSGLPADLNAGTGGASVFVAYRQHMVSLLGLRDAALSELPLDTGGAEEAAAAAGLDSSGLTLPAGSRGPGDRALSESAVEATKAGAAGSTGRRGAAAAAAAAASGLQIDGPGHRRATAAGAAAGVASGLEIEGPGHHSSPNLDLLAADFNGVGGADSAARQRTSTVGSYDTLLQPLAGGGRGAIDGGSGGGRGGGSGSGGGITNGSFFPQPEDGDSPPRDFLGLARADAGGRSGADVLSGEGEDGNGGGHDGGGNGGAESGGAAAWWLAREAVPGAASAAGAAGAAGKGHLYSMPGGDGGGPASPRLRDLMFLLLTAVHVRHGEVAEVAVGELTSLLIAADFFAADFRAVGAFEPPLAGSGGGCSIKEEPARTLLDFAVDAVCNQADQVMQARFPAVLQFLRAVVQRSSGRLSPAVLQRIFQTYSFMCSFSASSLPWLRMRGQLPFAPDDAAYASFKELLVVIFRRVETAGGAGSEIGPLGWGVWDGPLITFDEPPTLAALGATRIPAGDQTAAAYHHAAAAAITVAAGGGAFGESNAAAAEAAAAAAESELPREAVLPFMELLVHQMVNSAVDMVELATLINGVLESLRRHSSATADSLWGDMRAIGTRLFPPGSAGGSDGSGAMVAVFVVVAALCKMGTAPLRVMPSGELVARDLGNKILALDLLHEMLKACGERLRHNRVFGYVIRRLVVSAVLTNCHDGSALMDERAFQLLLGVVRMLWKHFRRHCKVELVVLLEDFLLKVLRASSRRVPAAWRMQVLDELLRWFDIPHNLVELFLNYDMDRKFIRQWKIFQEMCSLVCSMAEGWYIADAVTSAGNSGAAAAAAHEQDRAALRLQALRSAAQIVKSLMDASGHGHLIAQDPRTREISLGAAGGWEEDDTGSSSGGDDDVTKAEVVKARRLLAVSGGTLPQLPEEGVDPTLDAAFTVALTATSGPPTPSAADAETSGGDRSSGGGGRDRSGSERSGGAISSGGGGGGGEGRRAKNGGKRHRRPNSFRYRKELRKRAEEVMKQALDLYRAKGLKKAVQYLVGSSFIADTPHDIANFLRVYRDELDPAAIGEFLSEPDFDSGDYWKLIRLQYVRAISFHGMTLEEALRHLLTNSGFRLPGEAQKIDRLLSAFAECYYADNKGQPACPFASAETPYVLSYAIIMLNTDLHRANAGNSKKKRKRMTKDAFISNLRGVAGVSNSPEKGPGSSGNGAGPGASSSTSGDSSSGGVQRAYLSDIYDSIEARPIALLLQDGADGGGGGGGHNAAAAAAQEEKDPFGELAKAANQGQELLRGLSMFSHRFYVVGQDTSLSLDLVRLMYEAVWFHFHGVINSVLDRAHADVDTVLSCLDLVRYAISAATFLNMRTERAAFLTQLAKFRHRMAAGGSGSVGTNAGGVAANNPLAAAAADGYRAEPWFVAIESARPADAGAAVAQVHALVQQLEQSVHETYSKEELYAVARRIRNVDLLDADRRFLREGDLVKSCRSGKKVTYRFFLFSDQVLYAHCSFGGEWRVHEQLLLSLLKIANVKDKKDCRFQMQHPKKSFVVMAESAELKRLWMRDIANATQALLRERIDSRASLASSIHLDPEVIRAAAEAAGLPTAASGVATGVGGKQPSSHEGLRSPASALSLGDTVGPELGRSGRGGGSSAGGSPRNSNMSSTVSRALSRSPNFGFGAVKKRISKKLMPGGGSKSGGSQPASRRGSASSTSSAAAAAALASASLEAVLESSASEATSDHGLFDPSSAANTPMAAGRGSGGGASTSGDGSSPGRLTSLKARPPSPQPVGTAAAEEVGADLAQKFRAALHRYAEEAEKPQSPFTDTDKLVIYGLYKQARSGDCPDAVMEGVDPKESMKMQAWRANYGMSNAAAVESFIEILTRVVPDWEQGGTDAVER